MPFTMQPISSDSVNSSDDCHCTFPRQNGAIIQFLKSRGRGSWEGLKKTKRPPPEEIFQEMAQ